MIKGFGDKPRNPHPRKLLRCRHPLCKAYAATTVTAVCMTQTAVAQSRRVYPVSGIHDEVTDVAKQQC